MSSFETDVQISTRSSKRTSPGRFLLHTRSPEAHNSLHSIVLVDPIVTKLLCLSPTAYVGDAIAMAGQPAPRFPLQQPQDAMALSMDRLSPSSCPGGFGGCHDPASYRGTTPRNDLNVLPWFR
jgi:hypothetical protein